MPVAKKYGFDFTYEELRDYKKSLEIKDEQELDDVFLENVSGGDKSIDSCFLAQSVLDLNKCYRAGHVQ